jgi:hypothetical protein
MSANGTNGNGVKTPGPEPEPETIGDKVGRLLFELVMELRENRQLQMTHENRIVGLARVIVKQRIPFGPEQSEQVAAVIRQAGDISHLRGSLLYEKAAKVRSAGK